jgi:phage major head subunit gpT-like protein
MAANIPISWKNQLFMADLVLGNSTCWSFSRFQKTVALSCNQGDYFVKHDIYCDISGSADVSGVPRIFRSDPGAADGRAGRSALW